MKIAITDACIFIDLFEMDLVHDFFLLKLEIHTSKNIFYELFEEQQQILTAYLKTHKLTIHELESEDFDMINSEDYPKSLSIADKTAIHLANKINACILSSDKVLRNWAKNKKIEYHGILWILDQLVTSQIIKSQVACQKLEDLSCSNIMFKGNKKLEQEINKRMKIWK